MRSCFHNNAQALQTLPLLNVGAGISPELVEKLQRIIEAIYDPDLGAIGHELIQGLLAGNCTIAPQNTDFITNDNGPAASAAHTPFTIYKKEAAHLYLPFTNIIGLTVTDESDEEAAIIQFVHEAVHACKLIETPLDHVSPYNLYSALIPNIIPTPQDWIKRAVASEALPYALTTLIGSRLAQQNPTYNELVNPVSTDQFNFLRATNGDIRATLAITAQISMLSPLSLKTDKNGAIQQDTKKFIEHIIEHALNAYLECYLVQNPHEDLTLIYAENEDFWPLGRATKDINILKDPYFDCWLNINEYISPELTKKIETAQHEMIERFGEPKPFRSTFNHAPEALPIASQKGSDTNPLHFASWMQPLPRMIGKDHPDVLRPARDKNGDYINRRYYDEYSRY